ncbi:putative aryl-alcohol dehydrogenase aad14 [Penicillium rubens]|jgi:aryl-alcohol dehydrogenase-like predicted oxidoreductase|uniref:Aldo-keto reductase ausK n=2 Tax=Penicillium chrysogenum species complex TaxID=254878 RepID=B6HN98_PENRW|nr:uncharacterized protein N7525_007525 [Penicillium rubens]KAJ5266369.1 hypothetical protein N7524_007387 [Penicillium chrysogenum]CAP95835.1 Pc21g09380 [Penicillium rubens Wisconsin 54-1255]KAF3027871.1 putative aryl-alcohol dehydrogenase aad14 [Penicillium rubens]KAJ5049239.1 putative aryl-alcohol dehydrogenase aad14 [Penicillium rubens]KAJ5269658.1 hypothetical protein N7505_005416 [Penicillium chrysogenum]
MANLRTPAPEPATELGRYRVLSSTAGIRVSPLQLGAMSIGDAWSESMGSMSKEESFKLLDAFHGAGGNFIDTANDYQNEQSETWIGEWMAERKNRDQLVIATKFSTDFGSHKLGKGKAPNHCGNHKRSLHMSIRDSLKKLQTDWIDLLYVHWWDQTTSIEEVMDSLQVLVEQGKVLYLGISDTPAWVAAAANSYARAHGRTPFSIYQGRWNVLLRDFERDIIPMARHFGMALAPWDAMGGGKFKTKEEIEHRKAQGQPLRSLFSGEQTEEESAMSEALGKVAKEQGGKPITAIALAYVIAKAPNVFPLIGGRKIKHLEENIQALNIRLTTEQIEYLESQKEFDLGFPANFIGPDPKVTGKPTPLLASNAPYAFVRSATSITSPE